MRWLARLGGLCLALALYPMTPAGAQTPAADEAYAPVRVEGRTLFEIAGQGRLSAGDRADRVSRRLEALIARNTPVRAFTPADVRTWQDQPLITLGGEPILAITTSDAQDNLTTPQELAYRWGEQMAQAVADARAVRRDPTRGIGILIRNSFRDLLVSTVTWLPRFAGALLLFALFWLLSRGVNGVVRWTSARAHLDPNLQQLAGALAFYGTWIIGLIAIFSTLGFQTSGLIATLGVSGFVLGFAFKDVLSHFLAGLMLLLTRQFRIGDQILIKDQEGTVERIELRALHLRTYDNRLVIIPNADVINSVVTSNTASPHRRRELIITVDYGADLEQAQEIALRAVRDTHGVLREPPPDVLVDQLSPGGINLRVRFHVNSLRADYLRVGSEAMRRIKAAYVQEGVPFPVSTTHVVIDNPTNTPAERAAPDGQRAPAPDQQTAAPQERAA